MEGIIRILSLFFFSSSHLSLLPCCTGQLSKILWRGPKWLECRIYPHILCEQERQAHAKTHISVQINRRDTFIRHHGRLFHVIGGPIDMFAHTEHKHGCVNRFPPLTSARKFYSRCHKKRYKAALLKSVWDSVASGGDFAHPSTHPPLPSTHGRRTCGGHYRSEGIATH